MFKFSWIFEPKFRWFLDRFLDSKRKHRFCKNSAPACTGARFLRFRGIWNQQKINKNRCKVRTKKWYMSSPADFQKLKRWQKIRFKTPVKSSCIFMRILMIFASILALKTLPKSGCPQSFFDIFPKTRPRCPKTPPRHLQDASKTLQEASKTPLRPPKTSPRRLWTAQRRLQAPSSCLETPQDR